MNASVSVEMIVRVCPVCGVIYGLAEAFENERRQSHKNFFCPEGHTLCFSVSAPTPPPPVAEAQSEDKTFGKNFKRNGFGGHSTPGEN